MSVGTNVRAGRSTRALFGLQAAKGTPLANLSLASTMVLRPAFAQFDAGLVHSDPAWMSDDGAGSADAQHEVPTARSGELRATPTPQALEFFLRSHWGAYAANEFTRSTQPNEWATIALVENRHAVTSGNLVRFYDAWVHHLRMEIDSAGRGLLRAEYAAEASDVRALNARGDVTLPAANMEPGDVNEFAGRSATLTRDPDGDNEMMPFSRLALDLDGGLIENWFDSDQQVRVYSRGHRRVRVQLTGRVNDETWVALTASRAGTSEPYRLTWTAPSPAKTFTVDLHSIRWNPEPLITRGFEYEAFVASGVALIDDAGDYVDFTLA